LEGAFLVCNYRDSNEWIDATAWEDFYIFTCLAPLAEGAKILGTSVLLATALYALA